MNIFTKIFGRKNKLTEKDLKWNKMWDLWAEGELEQPISSLLTYEGEIQNGRHLQFFANLDSNKEIEKALKH